MDTAVLHDHTKAPSARSHHWVGTSWKEHDFILPSWDDIKVARKALLLPGLPDIISGGDVGTNERGDVVYQTLDGVDLNLMWDEYQRVLAMYNEQRDRLVDWLTYRVQNPIEQVRYPTQENFEEASEYGEPKGIRIGQPYNMGFDFRWFDLAIRFTWQFLMDAMQSQVDALHNQALEADNRLLFTKIFKTVFNPLDLPASVRNIPVTVYKFWNGDGIAPPLFKTYTFDGTHSHYITSGHAALETTGLQAIEDTLYHHGYSVMFGYQLVLMVNRQEGKLLRAARVLNGWEYDFIPAQGVGGGVILPASMGIVGQPQGLAGAGPAGPPGHIGTYGPFFVIEEDFCPPGYVCAFASGGPEGLDNPVGIREHQNTAVQGLQLIKGDEDYPLVDSFYRHGFGTGIRHRGGGAVMQITTSGTYTVPAQYA